MRPSSLIAAAVVGIALGSQALGEDDASQWQSAGFQNTDAWSFMPNQPPISDRQIEAMGEALLLDEDQRAVVDDLLGALKVRHRHAWVSFAEQRADAQHAMSVTQDYGSHQSDLQTLMGEFKDEQDGVVDAFFSDVRLILTPEQEEAWPRIEIDRRRATTLVAYASFNDEAIDLVAIAAALDISDEVRAALEPVLDQYAQTLDPVLEARNRKLEALGKDLRDIETIRAKAMTLDPENPDQNAMMLAYQEAERRQSETVPRALEARKASARVRDVNREFKREIERLLPESALEDWTKATTFDLTQNRYPFMSGSRAERILALLENLEQMLSAYETQMNLYAGDEMDDYAMIIRAVEPLDADQRERLERIRETHEARMERIDQTHTPAGRDRDDDEPKSIQIKTPYGTLSLSRIADEPQHMRGFWPGGQQGQDPELLKARAEAEQEAIDQIRRVLTINQRAIVAYH